MTAADVTRQYGGEPFEFTYDHVDLADTIVFSTDNNWGIYSADSSVVVGSTLTPGVGTDGVTSLAGSWTGSVTLYHLTAFTSAHIHWVGSGVTVQYSFDDVTWTTLPEDGVIALSPDNASFDVKISFPGGIANDPAELTSLTAYILKTETMWSSSNKRQLTFGDDLINGSITIDTAVSVAAETNTGTLDPSGPAQAGSANLNFGTVEMWINLASGTSFSPDLPAGTTYVNGVVATPSAGSEIHIVRVLTTPGNYAFSIGPNCTLSHLAVYPGQMTAAQVSSLYTASSGTLPTISIHDPAAIAVTEAATPGEVYAYNWSIVPGRK